MATILRDSAVVLVGACPQEDYEKSLFHLVHWARHERNLRDKKMATQDPRVSPPGFCVAIFFRQVSFVSPLMD